MLGAALGALGMSRNNGEYAVDTSGGLKGLIEQLKQRKNTVGVGNSPAPNIPMSESYNSAASSPVFPPAAQERGRRLRSSLRLIPQSTSRSPSSLFPGSFPFFRFVCFVLFYLFVFYIFFIILLFLNRNYCN